MGIWPLISKIGPLVDRRFAPWEGAAPWERRTLGRISEINGQIHEAPVVARVDLAVDLEDRPVGRQQLRLVEGAVALVESYLLTDVLLHEFLARQEIVLVDRKSGV